MYNLHSVQLVFVHGTKLHLYLDTPVRLLRTAQPSKLPSVLNFQTQNRMKLMADNYEDDHLRTAPDQTNHKPSPDQVPQLLTLPDGFSSFSPYLELS